MKLQIYPLLFHRIARLKQAGKMIHYFTFPVKFLMEVFDKTTKDFIIITVILFFISSCKIFFRLKVWPLTFPKFNNIIIKYYLFCIKKFNKNDYSSILLLVTISFITNGVWYSIKSCLKCIGKVRKIAMHFGGFETAKVILFVFPFRVHNHLNMTHHYFQFE